ncbi:MAG: hypothetical protein LUG18_01475 [Candidatus Azobacteroides sp.]|nr:hypothetical protein [Candidatus Azobacteroides sp.]
MRYTFKGDNTDVGFTHYYPFGMEYSDEGIRNMNSAERFTGHEFQTQHGLNLSDMGWRSYDASSGRTPTMDKRAEDYYWISPYVYCANNPLKWVDLDGENIYFITSDGRVFLLAPPDEDSKEDTVYGIGENNEVQSIIIKDQKLMPQLMERRGKGKESYGTTQNKNDAFNLFKFAADNSDVEWSLSGFKKEGKTNFYVGTSQEATRSDVGSGTNFPLEDLIFNVHSHPDKINGTKGASGFTTQQTVPGGGVTYHKKTDMGLIGWMYEKLNYERYPNMYVYHRGTKNLYQFTPWNPDILRGKGIQSGKRLKSIIYP